MNKHLCPLADELVSRSIRPYAAVPVELSFQNFGNSWLCMLRGPTALVQAVFDGFHNWRGANGQLEWFDDVQTVGVFWSSRDRLRRFFFNVYYVRAMNLVHFKVKSRAYRVHHRRIVRLAMRHALTQLDILRNECQETVVRYADSYTGYDYGTGTITAEKPDYDGKDLSIFVGLNGPATE